jgi:hypothetical protein
MSFYFMSFQKGVSTEKLLEKQIRINQVSVSAARWQHLSQICFANLILWKVTKFSITQQSLKLEKNKYRFAFLRIFILKFMHEGLNFKIIKILLNKISHWFLLTTITIKKVKLCYKFQFWRETTHANQRRQCCSLSFATPTTDCYPIFRVVKCLASDCSTVAEYWTHPLRSKVQIWLPPLAAREREIKGKTLGKMVNYKIVNPSKSRIRNWNLKTQTSSKSHCFGRTCKWVLRWL